MIPLCAGVAAGATTRFPPSTSNRTLDSGSSKSVSTVYGGGGSESKVGSSTFTGAATTLISSSPSMTPRTLCGRRAEPLAPVDNPGGADRRGQPGAPDQAAEGPDDQPVRAERAARRGIGEPHPGLGG